MPLRMVNYAVLLKFDRVQDLRLRHEGLATVAPMVIYRGRRPWNAATDFRLLHGEVPESLLSYVPS